MKRTVALLVLLALAPTLAQAQFVPPPGDVDLSELSLTREPTVAVANVVRALVYNNGTQPVYATVQFTYSDGTPLTGQAGVDDTNARMIPAQSRSFLDLTWVPESDRAGPQILRAVLRAQGDPSLHDNEKTLATFVRAPAVNVTLEPPLRLNLSSGSTGFLRYAVRNDGNAPDTFLLEVQGNASWRPRLLGEPGLVPPGQTRYGEVAYTAPTSGTDMNLTVRVHATSTQRANAFAVAAAPLLRSVPTLPHVPRIVALDGLPTDAQVLPGENMTYRLTLRNGGAAEDVVLVNASFGAAASDWRLNLTAPANATGWNATYVDGNGTLAVPLSPGQSRALLLNVSRLANATGDVANLTLNVTTNDSALLRALQPAAEYAPTLRASFINASPELALVGIRQPPRTYQGDRLVLGVEVANLGRVTAPPSVVRLEITDGTFVLREVELNVSAVAPGTTTSLSWSNVTSDLQGRFRIVARLTPNATISPADRSLLNNGATGELLVRRPEFTLRGPDVVDVVPGTRLSVLGAATGLSLTNQGLSDETFEVALVNVTPGASWLAERWTVDVPASGTVVLPLSVDVPRYPHLSSAVARVRAIVEGRPEFSANATLTFHVDDQQGPDARILAPLAPTTVGEPTRIRVEADDATGIGDATVVIVTPSGQRVLLTLRPNATNATWLETNHTPLRPGPHVLEVRLGDATPARHATDLPNLTWVVRERPYRGFEPVGFAEGDSIGAPYLKLREVENGTTATLEVDVGVGYRSVAFPYEVRPTGWAEGPHVLRARATSMGGQTWNGSWNVTYDATPPALSDLELDLRSGLATVTVRASGASSVVARFAGEGRPYEAALHPAGGGTWSASVRPPGEWTLLTVVAQDDAGNVASLDHASGRRALPLPPPWALLALGLAAAGMRPRKVGE